jgi:hypothetical protein
VQSSPGAAARPRARLRPWRVALGLVVVLVAAGLRVGSQARPGWAVDLPTPAGAVTLAPVADATVAETSAEANLGRDGRLKADGSPQESAYLRFAVAPQTGGRAILRLWVLDGTKDGPDVSRVDGVFDEATLTWMTRPRLLSGTPVEGAVLATKTWAEYDVTDLVTGRAEPDVTLALIADGTDGVDFASRESAQPPQLVIIAPVEATFGPSADSRVEEKSPTANYGTAAGVAVDSGRGVGIAGYLRFAVSGVEGAVLRATLRLMVSDGSAGGAAVSPTSGQWSETALTWATRPAATGAALLDSGPVAPGWAEFDVTGAVVGNGDVNLMLSTASTDGLWFRSREWAAEAERPQLVVVSLPPATTPAEGPPPTTSSTTMPPTSSSTTTTTSTTTSSTTMSSTTTTSPPVQPQTPTSTTTTTRPVGPVCSPGWDEGTPIGTLAHGLGEMSGLVASPNHRQWAWGIRDSGNAPSFAVRPTGDSAEVIEYRTSGTRNSDWEDIAWTRGYAPGSGQLWVLENVGNGWSGNRRIYQFEEPDPTELPGHGGLLGIDLGLFPPPPPTARLIGSYVWAYPDVQANTEAMFVFDGDLVVVSKTSPSRVYRFSGPLLPFTVNVPRYVGTLPAGNTLSVASLSADQRTLAVASHSKVFFYENRGDRRDLVALVTSDPVFFAQPEADNREGGTFFPHDSCDLLLVAESKTLWQLRHQ